MAPRLALPASDCAILPTWRWPANPAGRICPPRFALKSCGCWQEEKEEDAQEKAIALVEADLETQQFAQRLVWELYGRRRELLPYVQQKYHLSPDPSYPLGGL